MFFLVVGNAVQDFFLGRFWAFPTQNLDPFAHFFEHYTDLEEGKWVKILGWEGPESAKKEILDGIANYQKANA